MFFSLSTYLIVTNIPSVRNMMCTSDQVVKFFEYSPKKQTVLEKLIDETVNDETSRTKLKQVLLEAVSEF
jgi:hypothetical protein